MRPSPRDHAMEAKSDDVVVETSRLIDQRKTGMTRDPNTSTILGTAFASTPPLWLWLYTFPSRVFNVNTKGLTTSNTMPDKEKRSKLFRKLIRLVDAPRSPARAVLPVLPLKNSVCPGTSATKPLVWPESALISPSTGIPDFGFSSCVYVFSSCLMLSGIPRSCPVDRCLRLALRTGHSNRRRTSGEVHKADQYAPMDRYYARLKTSSCPLRAPPDTREMRMNLRARRGSAAAHRTVGYRSSRTARPRYPSAACFATRFFPAGFTAFLGKPLTRQ